MSKTSDLINKSHSKRGAPGTLKRKVKGKMTIAKAHELKNRRGATTMDKKQANFFINMQKEEAMTAADAGIPHDTKNMGPSRLPTNIFRRKMGIPINVTDRRRKKTKSPVLLKQFRKYYDG
mgnify:CR=1 FL=1|tara:strand:- start:370 stop:732 length:363 start_codon:yes stop_codon:yes gene_type:complete